jgi:hypothetical protein
MTKFLQLALWNANGLPQQTEKLQLFISIQDTDVMLISKTQFTGKSYLEIPIYTVYHTNYPAGTARGRTAIIIKSSIQYH